MILNLINDNWIPVRRRNGEKALIAPSQITDLCDSNPFVAFDAPRPDFNGALIQFFIGLIQTSFAPKDVREWRKYFSNPPSNEQLQEKLALYAYAFNLGGDGPRFMQDLTLESEITEKIITKYPNLDKSKIKIKISEEALSIDELFIDSVASYFNKRGRIQAICPKCAATALLTLQLNAPAGGRGHRTSLRGGGPLTTLVLGNSLWQTIWLNVLEENKFLDMYKTKSEIEERFTDKDIFPWLAKAITSEETQKITSQDAHPSQIFWATPRRIHLDFDTLNEGICSIDQSFSSQLISRYFTKSYGTNYENWQHPLTPHYVKEGVHMPVHAQPGGISYRHWLGLVQNDEEKGNFRARTVKEFLEKQEQKYKVLQDYRFRLWVFGYDMDNMKPRGWVESTMPVIIFEDQEHYEETINQLIKVSEKISENTRSCIKKALFKKTDEIRGNLSFIDAEFWQNTETDFYNALEAFRANVNNIPEIKSNWLKILKKVSENIFDKISQNSEIESVDPKRIALAYRDLSKFNNAKNILKILHLSK